MKTRSSRSFAYLLAGLALCLSTGPSEAGITVIDNGYSFRPDPVTIVVGDFVYWEDDGSGPYEIASLDNLWAPFLTPGGLVFTQVGSYQYYDDAGDFGTVNVVADTPPSVSITDPATNAVFTAPASFLFAANAVDTAEDGLSDVEFFIGTNLVDDVFDIPYSTSITNLGVGSYVLTVIAFDNVGVSATNSINISVESSAPITLAGLSTTPGQFSFNASGLIVGKTNILQSSTNLESPANWQAVSTNLAAGNSASFMINVSPGAAFFRVIQLP